MTCPRLIEVALPIREISAESVRQKSAQRGHISTLHMWWARRPLAASRAVVFASTIPDPDHEECPAAFRSAVGRHLKDHVAEELRYYRSRRDVVRDEDPYRPYLGVPDTLRNRLLMFIAKWSPQCVEFQEGRISQAPDPSDLLDDRSLVKWETSDPGNPQGQRCLSVARELVLAAADGRIPVVLDPFAGGGAIPLESARLGCSTIANDYNPVANVILRATCQYPLVYGKPGIREVVFEDFGTKTSQAVSLPNVLAADVERLAKQTLDRVRCDLEHLYPPGSDRRPVLAYLWARTVPCSNPSCRGTIPLLRSLQLRSKRGNVALTLDADRRTGRVSFGIARDDEIKQLEGTKRQRGPAVCPFCKQPTSEPQIRRAGIEGQIGQVMTAVVISANGEKDFRRVEATDLTAYDAACQQRTTAPTEFIVPEINSPNASPRAGAHRSISLEQYGFVRWGQLFNHRQLVLLDHFVAVLHELAGKLDLEFEDDKYATAVLVYLALWIDRIAAFSNSFTRWTHDELTIKTPFNGQSVPMMWDYPEVNPFAVLSGTPLKQLEFLLAVLQRECRSGETIRIPRVLLGSATSLPLREGDCDHVVTDPPYGNSIAYADLSDFFYVWLKRTVADRLPDVFCTPQTPKELEATSHKHRHEGSQKQANAAYQSLLSASFLECKRVTKAGGVVAVMFAHQSTDAWVALLSALFDAGLSPVATWPIATELPNASLGIGTASLERSVTVVCHLRVPASAASFKQIRAEIGAVVKESVHRFWQYGLRGADLIVACYGPAVGVFGRYSRVERADGTPVEIPELLELARKAARDAIAGDFQGDSLSTLYYVWANLYGTSVQSWDDARLVVQIGSDAENAMDVARGRDLFVLDGAECRLALLADRVVRRDLGDATDAPLIDQLHHAMHLWQQERRGELVGYLRDHDLFDQGPFWKLTQALFEVLPRDQADWRLVSALLGERETLRMEARRAGEGTADEDTLPLWRKAADRK